MTTSYEQELVDRFRESLRLACSVSDLPSLELAVIGVHSLYDDMKNVGLGGLANVITLAHENECANCKED